MAVPTEFVQAQVKEFESSGGGTGDDEDGLTKPIDDTEDITTAAGMRLGESGKPARTAAIQVGCHRDGDRLVFYDADHQLGVDTKTLTELVGGAASAISYRRHFLLMGG